MSHDLLLSRRDLLTAGAGAFVASSSGLLPARPSRAAPLTTSTAVVEPHVVVQTAHGKLRGGHSRGALAFKGIPYAGPVSGKGRFKAPPPVRPWTGVRDAFVSGTPALQGSRV